MDIPEFSERKRLGLVIERMVAISILVARNQFVDDFGTRAFTFLNRRGSFYSNYKVDYVINCCSSKSRRMRADVNKLMDFYRKEITNNIVNPMLYKPSQDFLKMAALFSPGAYYCYILNFSNLKMEFVDGNTKGILGLDPEEVSTDVILSMLLPNEFPAFEKKEAVVVDFFFNFLNPEAIQSYKVLYYLRLKNKGGIIKTIMHQVITLTVSDSGITQHVLGIHTDITHMNIPMNHHVSFLAIGPGQSYVNCNSEMGRFDSGVCTPIEEPLFGQLTRREIEMVQFFSDGFTANEIADKLNISPNTVRTHRQNLLAKMGCKKTSEVVKKCVASGIV